MRQPTEPAELATQMQAVTARLASEATSHRRTQRALWACERRLEDFAATTSDFFWETDAALNLAYVSEHFEGIFGLAADKIIGKTLTASPLGGLSGVKAWEECTRRLRVWQTFDRIEFTWNRPDGTARVVQISGKPVFGEDRAFLGYRGTGRDITESHHLSEELSYQASHDSLTGLVNRHEFERRLQHVLEQTRREKTENTLCYLDLDQFKVINDTCGHAAGDELLRQVAKLLVAQIRRSDTLARLGGDEFGLLLESCSPIPAKRVALKLQRALESFRFTWEGKIFGVSASIGVVSIDEESGKLAHLLSRADAACFAAKEQGRRRIYVYREDDAEMARRTGEMHWVARINRALEDSRFRLFVQPIMPVATSRAEGHHYELLIRMESEDGSLAPPGAFLPAAERYNLSPMLDRWVIDTGLAWLADHPEHVRELSLCAINLSGHSLGDESFAQFVIDRLRSWGIPPEKICFEVTETAAVANLFQSGRLIQRLKNLGCRFALDDFGSGLSSFAYLKNLPADFIKIDGAFVRDIADDPISRAMVRSIHEIGRVMGKITIAEFVENEAILTELREIGVDYAQGYGIGPPMPLAEIAGSGARARMGAG